VALDFEPIDFGWWRVILGGAALSALRSPRLFSEPALAGEFRLLGPLRQNTPLVFLAF